MTSKHELFKALRDVLPYAESRAEDLVEFAERCVDESCECGASGDLTCQEAARRAVAAVDAAHVILGTKR